MNVFPMWFLPGLLSLTCVLSAAGLDTPPGIAGPFVQFLGPPIAVKAQVSGRFLLAANPVRGLQILEISRPDHPMLVAELPTAGSIQAIHVLSDSLAAVIFEVSSYSSRLAVVRFAETPEIIATLDLPGRSEASQLSGNMLHVALREHVPMGNFAGRWLLVTLNMLRPSAPRIAASLPLALASAPVVRLTPGFAFIPNSDGLHVIPLSAASPRISVAATIPLAGPVIQAPGAIEQQDGMLRFATDKYVPPAEEARPYVGHFELAMEVWSLADPLPVRLGSWSEERESETYKVKIDGDRFWARRGYLLALVDFKNPASPAAAREVTLRDGFFDFLPLGDRFLLLGYTGGKITCDLFDLDFFANSPARPIARFQRATTPDIGGVYPTLTSENVFMLGRQRLIRIPFSVTGTDAQPSAKGTAFLEVRRNQLVSRGTTPTTVSLGTLLPYGTRLLTLTSAQYRSFSVPGIGRPRLRSILTVGPPGIIQFGFGFSPVTEPMPIVTPNSSF